MQAFAALLDQLVLTPSRNAKLAHMAAYFAEAPDPARGWALAAITRDLDLKSVKPAAIRAMAEERVDPVLFQLSYDYVGDLAETVSLVWPNQQRINSSPSLEVIVESLQSASKTEGLQLFESWMNDLAVVERWALIKLVTGGLRIGVSSRLAKIALAKFGQIDVTEIEEIWHGLTPPYASLFAWLEGKSEKPQPDIAAPFRPVMLAHPLVPKKDRGDPGAIDPLQINADTFAAEWKWDGIRVQAVTENGTRRIYTRTGDDISHTFPDVTSAMDFTASIDGELLIRRADGSTAPFNELQQRLNRKTVSKKMMEARPAFIRAYDILEHKGEDLRGLEFRKRRKRLEQFILECSGDRLDLSELVDVTNLSDLEALRNNPPNPDIEGLMLKRWDSVYEAGRPKGKWFKWKRDPHLIDAVLMYAQRGHGKRSGFYSDFTFGVWQDVNGAGELTPVGKAYFGFTNEELKEIDKFVRDNTIDRFGPVRSVKATKTTGLVFEVAFEGLNRSRRHKSGIAMRFPRINRIRWDKPPSEADTLQSLHSFLVDLDGPQDG